MPQMTAYFLLQGQRGGCSKIRDEGVPKPYSHIYLILLWLSTTHRPPLCRAREKKGDDSDPPKKWGVMRPRVGVQCGTPTRVSQGVAIVGIYPCGKARNSPPEGVLTEGRQTYEMAVAPVGKNPLSPRPG